MTTNLETYINPNAPLELNSIIVDEAYGKKWNVHNEDFKLLCKEGKPLRNTLYRLGGLSSINDLKKDYFLILKYVEDIYDYEFIKSCYPKKSRKELEQHRYHLKGIWVIMDKLGNERVEFSQFEHPSLQGGVIYSFKNKYYNIETGYCYGQAYSSMSSDEYLFIDNAYDNDKSKRGIIKIHKATGSYELFPKK